MVRSSKKRVARFCEPRRYAPGETIFEAEASASEIQLVLAGEVDVYLGEPPARIGGVGEGECLGEVSALSGLAHSATAVARDHVETAVLSHESLDSLIRRRPDVGVVLFRNLAAGLGEKLQRSDLALLEK